MSKKNDQEFIAEARRRFKESASAESDLRKEYVEDAEFEDGKQWDDVDEIVRVNRPCPVINKVKGHNKVIIGEARQNRPRIKVRPVDDKTDPALAQLLTGLIRNIENVSDADVAYDCGIESAVRGSIGYWRILTEYADDMAFDQDVKIARIVNPLAVYYDQSAQEADYSDAQWAFIVQTISKQKFEKKYPGKSAEWDTGEGESDAGWFTEESVRLSEYWYKEPVVKHVFMLADGRTVHIDKPEMMELPHPETMEPTPVVILDGQPVPYLKERKANTHRVRYCTITGGEILDGPNDWAGKYIPIVPCLGEEVWIKAKRRLHSAHHHSKDAQKQYNWARANMIETLAQAPKQPYLMTPEMIEGYENEWNMSHQTPKPYLLYHSGPNGEHPERLAPSIQDTGAREEAMVAADDIQSTMGMFDPSMGAEGQAKSGIAIGRLQSQGRAATFVFTDNQMRAIKYTGKILVDLIPKIYDSERVVRLLGEDGQEEWAAINQKSFDPVTGQTRVINDISVGRYDVVVDASAGYLTKRMEAAEGMLQFLQSAPPLAPVLLPRVAKSLDWPDSEEIGEEVQNAINPPPPPPPEPGPKDLLDLEKGKLELQGKQIDLETKKQEAALKGQEGMQMVQQVAAETVMQVLQQIGLIAPNGGQ